jgi:hypothetical protein
MTRRKAIREYGFFNPDGSPRLDDTEQQKPPVEPESQKSKLHKATRKRRREFRPWWRQDDAD